MESEKIMFGVIILIGIVGLVLLLQSEITGKMYYMTPEEACARHMDMCGDNLPPVFTGRTDMRTQGVECVCQTNPHKVGWRSLILEYGRVSS